MMQIIAPPQPPAPVTFGEDNSYGRVDTRLWQIWLTLLTVFLTTWLCTLGTIPAILALVTSKHVLVAILAMGLQMDAPRRTT